MFICGVPVQILNGPAMQQDQSHAPFSLDCFTAVLKVPGVLPVSRFDTSREEIAKDGINWHASR